MSTGVGSAPSIFVSNYTTVIPSPEPEAETTSFTPVVEPRPQWDIARSDWGVVWPLHWVGFAAIFFLQAAIFLYIFIRLKYRSRKNTRKGSLNKFTNTICIVLIICALSRGFYMMIDPYESKQCIFGNQNNCPLWFNRTLFSLALPGLTIVFLLFHFAFLQVTKVQGMNTPGKLQSTVFLVSFSLFNYVLAIASDVTVAYINIKEVLIPCQIYFILLGIILAGAFMYSGSQIVYSTHRNWQEINKVRTDTARKISAGDINKVNSNTTKFIVSPQLRKTLFLTGVTVAIWLIYVILQVVSFVLTYSGALSNWWWISLETCYRFCEFFLASFVYSTATRQSTPSRQPASSGVTTNYKSNSYAANETVVIMNNQAHQRKLSF